MRVDLVAWAAAAAMAGIAGMLWLRTARGQRRPAALPAGGLPRRGTSTPLFLDGGRAALLALLLSLFAISAGLAWRSASAGSWPGAASGEAMAALAAGALLCAAWQARRDLVKATVTAIAATAVLLLAIALAWLLPPAGLAGPALPGAPGLAHNWLLGLHTLLAGLGLGGWLGALGDGLQPWWRPYAGEGPASPGLSAIEFSFPWLTAALLASIACSAAGYAVAWRGLPAEIWLLVAWLLGGSYLAAAGSWSIPGTRRLSPPMMAWYLLTLAGCAAAIVAAWQAPSLL